MWERAVALRAFEVTGLTTPEQCASYWLQQQWYNRAIEVLKGALKRFKPPAVPSPRARDPAGLPDWPSVEAFLTVYRFCAEISTSVCMEQGHGWAMLNAAEFNVPISQMIVHWVAYGDD
jgi:hypothetical protein